MKLTDKHGRIWHVNHCRDEPGKCIEIWRQPFQTSDLACDTFARQNNSVHLPRDDADKFAAAIVAAAREPIDNA